MVEALGISNNRILYSLAHDHHLLFQFAPNFIDLPPSQHTIIWISPSSKNSYHGRKTLFQSIEFLKSIFPPRYIFQLKNSLAIVTRIPKEDLTIKSELIHLYSELGLKTQCWTETDFRLAPIHIDQIPKLKYFNTDECKWKFEEINRNFPAPDKLSSLSVL